MSDSLGVLLATLGSSLLFDLEQPRRSGDPTFPGHWPGFSYTLHRRHEAGLERRTSASGMLYMADHSGTHIDALCHQAYDLRLSGDVQVNARIQTSRGFTEQGIDQVAPILRRGVLLDVAEERDLPRRSLVEEADLERARDRAGVEIRPGDVALVRTGYGRHWDDASRYLEAPGISAEASGWLGNQGVFAVGADNVAWDLPERVDPATGTTLPGHVLLLVDRGVHIIENLYLEELRASGRGPFLFVALPVKIWGATGAPVRPLAIVPSEEG